MQRALGLSLFLAACGLPGIDVGQVVQPEPQPEPGPELNACEALYGSCAGAGNACPDGTVASTAAACSDREACCVVDDCSSNATKETCEAARCTWFECPPAADCKYATACLADCRTLGCPSGKRCEQCWADYACLDSNSAC